MEGPREGQHNNLLIGWQGKFKLEKPLYHIGPIYPIGGFLLSVSCMIIGIFFVYSAIPMWLDFPTYITRSYSSTTGIISDSFDPT